MTEQSIPAPITGRCACDAVVYRVNATPLIVHCCQCHSCQRETGSGFAINFLIEATNVELLPSCTATPIDVDIPSASGLGQTISRCPKCFVALWSTYGGAGPFIKFVRVGTMDEEYKSKITPTIGIFAKSKLPWVSLAEEIPTVPDYYNPTDYYTDEAMKRREKLLPQIMQYMKEKGLA